jgi:hypothetical protein
LNTCCCIGCHVVLSIDSWHPSVQQLVINSLPHEFQKSPKILTTGVGSGVGSAAAPSAGAAAPSSAAGAAGAAVSPPAQAPSNSASTINNPRTNDNLRMVVSPLNRLCIAWNNKGTANRNQESCDRLLKDADISLRCNQSQGISNPHAYVDSRSTRRQGTS